MYNNIKKIKSFTYLSPADGKGMSSAFSYRQTCPWSFELHHGLYSICWVPGMQMFADRMTWSLLKLRWGCQVWWWMQWSCRCIHSSEFRELFWICSNQCNMAFRVNFVAFLFDMDNQCNILRKGVVCLVLSILGVILLSCILKLLQFFIRHFDDPDRMLLQ